VHSTNKLVELKYTRRQAKREKKILTYLVRYAVLLPAWMQTCVVLTKAVKTTTSKGDGPDQMPAGCILGSIDPICVFHGVWREAFDESM
jgi:hypothetical protein